MLFNLINPEIAAGHPNDVHNYHPLVCFTTLPTRTDGATQIGSQHASQTKLFRGLTSSRVATIFAVHARLIVLATRLNFHVYGWAPGPCETLP
jgi:hypothetical protein